MSNSFFPLPVPSGRIPFSGRPGSWGSQVSSVTSTITSTAIPTSTPPDILSTGFPAPSASQPSSALAGTTHQNVNLKIALPVCLVIVGLAVILAIIRFRCIRKRSRESDKPEPVDPYPIDVERGPVVGMTQKGDRGFAPTGIIRFSAPFTHQPNSTTEVPSEREQQLGNQLTAVIQKLEALETAVQTSTGYQGSNRTSNLDEQPPDYTAIHSTGGSVEVGAGPSGDRKVEHQ